MYLLDIQSFIRIKGKKYSEKEANSLMGVSWKAS